MAAHQCLPLICVLFATALAEPTPGRIPKVYNALITSNQNLEPSKAYPVYQPVLHNTFPFPFQTVVYGDYPLTNGLLPLPLPASPPSGPSPKPEASPSPSTETPAESESSKPSPDTEENNANSEKENATPSPPPPPQTESPIPLNEFGLPPQVLPLGRLNPSYEFTQIPSFPYAYPGFRFYDPYDPFGFHPYANFPLYRPLTNVLGPALSIPAVKSETPALAPAPAAVPSNKEQNSETPPSEPSDLNVLNYSSKDPAIPNVPPPPLPQGGLKTEDE